MLVKILKTFPFSPDGIVGATAVEGSVVDIRDELIPGLEALDYVERDTKETKKLGASPENKTEVVPVDVAPAQKVPTGDVLVDEKSKIDIPKGWEELSWPSLRMLAGQLTEEQIKSKDDALAAINSELDRRKSATASTDTTTTV